MSTIATGSDCRTYRPRWKRSLGTLRPFFSAWPRPDNDGLDMRNETRDQDGNVLQIFTVKMPVFKRPQS